MNDKRIAIGLAAWFLGVIVPVGHHVALHAAIAHGRTSNDIGRMGSVWDFLPWVDWAYSSLMFLVGAILVYSGLTAGRTTKPERRGLDVIDLPTSGHGR
jgi:hypothetical protein